MRTRKIVYYGVRNKICCICDMAKAKKQKPKEHKRFKNWSKSANSMEKRILVQGFTQSMEMHGVMYSRFVGKPRL